MQKITLLGSTGSIGQNTLDVIARHPDRYQVFALSANQNTEMLLQQCLQFKPDYAVMQQIDAAQRLAYQLRELHLKTGVLVGEESLIKIANHPQTNIVLAAIVGAAGLMPTLAAAKAGKRILLANKEALVMSGPLFMQAVRDNHAILLPIDSEHNAIFQCLPANYQTGHPLKGVKHITLTASGGPFRHLPLEELSKVTAAQACKHPNWVMGKKISVDSATMMNKALEVIEAHWLFNLEPTAIKVLLHPQSIIHSMVQYQDGSVLAQLGNPDMRTPIAQALAWPERIDAGVEDLDLADIAQLNFTSVSLQRYPALQLAYDALKIGGTATAILNAANEIAVASFLDEKISFTDISKINQYALKKLPGYSMEVNLETIYKADAAARDLAAIAIDNITNTNNLRS